MFKYKMPYSMLTVMKKVLDVLFIRSFFSFFDLIWISIFVILILLSFPILGALIVGALGGVISGVIKGTLTKWSSNIPDTDKSK